MRKEKGKKEAAIVLAKSSEVLSFWFEELEGKQRFEANDERDEAIRARFGAVHAQASRGELFSWRTTAAGRLAEIVVLDQFSRNICRGHATAFAQDGMALCLAQEVVATAADKALVPSQHMFVYMPYMHSESLAIHDASLPLFEALATEGEHFAMTLDFEHRHRVIVERFGRYPHRNAILGRVSTPQEEAFLKEPGSSF